MDRGDIRWAQLPDSCRIRTGYRRPVLIIQSNTFNRSRIRTVVAAVVTSNLRLAEAPGNVFLPASVSGLPKDSVVNVSQIITVDREFLKEPCGRVSARVMKAIDEGLRLVLSL